MSLAANSSATAVPLISGVQYFPFGAPESWLLGSSTSSKDYTRLIDASSRIQKYTTPTGYRALTFDNGSRITAINDYLGTSTTPNATQTHTYDNAGRITSFTGYTSNGVNPTTGAGNTSITQTQSFTYDNNGNRLTSTLNGTTSSYAIQGTSNRLLSVSSSMGGMSKTNTFDATGNLTSDGTTSLAYDGRGRLTATVSPVSGVTTTMGYLINYQQLRVRKANANSASTAENKVFVYDDSGKMLGEYDHAGNAIQELVWLNDTPVAVTGTMPCLTATTTTSLHTTGQVGAPSCTETATAYIFTDHLNTPREIALIGASAANGNNANAYTSLWKWDSLPFGETQANENSSGLGLFTFNHRFPGQYRDRETGLHQNWHRDYDPGLGRYVESDPLGLLAGLNTFRYARNSPTHVTDSMGLLASIACTRCGRSGAMGCTVTEDDSITFTFVSNTGRNDRSAVTGDPYGTNGPLPPGTYGVTIGGNTATFPRDLAAVTGPGMPPGQLVTPDGTVRTGLWFHTGNFSQGCFVVGRQNGLTGENLESLLAGVVRLHLSTGGTSISIREVECGQ